LKQRKPGDIRRWLHGQELGPWPSWCDVFSGYVFTALNGTEADDAIDDRLDGILPLAVRIRHTEDTVESFDVPQRDTSPLPML